MSHLILLMEILQICILRESNYKSHIVELKVTLLLVLLKICLYRIAVIILPVILFVEFENAHYSK